ncbi:hypothetical protein [uncultured Methanobrevibacter sp.]|uniref:hypothetical protein n=1 Tax=uncultured Methanobrevibacter sp. TaxID=253161 RepID=UPI0026DFFB26|nr:hypothetical protein [uncultured Methanobrevibacter sp.]
MSEALILTVGGSNDPIIYSINNINHDFIYFIHSKSSLKNVQEIVDSLNIDRSSYACKEIDDFESLEESYLSSKEIIEDAKDNFSKIHVDFTSGTKPMVAGLVLAASKENLTLSYVGSNRNKDARDKNGVGSVKEGFEELKIINWGDNNE